MKLWFPNGKMRGGGWGWVEVKQNIRRTEEAGIGEGVASYNFLPPLF